jgi:aminobenzoyl-glutamate utilization protein B
MRRIALLLLALLAVLVAEARTPKKGKADIGVKYLDANFAMYDSLQKSIFNYAETAYGEFRSADQWTRYLESEGFTVERNAGGIPTAFVASFGSGSPVIGMMAEYDAIAGMSQDTVPYRKPLVPGAPGHACGHNVLGTGSIAGAVAVSKYLAASGASGTVKLFGCPAEEGGGGKVYMMTGGVFDGLDAMLDWHPDTRNTVNKATGLANVQVLFTFKGKSSHASGAPDAGRSALDAVESFNYMMNMMREHVPQTSRIHYVITDGGKAPNVVPDRASVKYFFRSPSRETVQDILSRALKAAEGAAMGTGTTFDYELVSGNYERLPNDEMAALVGRSLQKVGGISLDEREMAFAREVASVSGANASLIDRLSIIVPPADEGYEAYVSSDVGNVTWAVPTGSFRYSCFTPGGVGHSWQQVASCGTTIGTKGAIGAAKVLYYSAVELITDARLLSRVREEFLSRRGPDFTFQPMMGNRRPPFRSAATMSTCIDREMFDGLPADENSLQGKTLKADTSALTYFIKPESVLNQEDSGRCWFFSTSTVLGGDISRNYIYFWDLLEKSNLFLCEVWNHRKEALDSRFNEKIFRRPIWDGGHFMDAVYLVEKYGIVPESAMPETEVSLNPDGLKRVLRQLLRGYGLKLRESTEPEALRQEALKEVYKLLEGSLGTPPESGIRKLDMSGYSVLMNDPTRPYHKMYRVEGSRGAYDAPDWTFLNLPMEELEAIGIKSLASGERFYFTADTDAYSDKPAGVYSLDTYDIPSLTKEELFRSYGAVSAHAMAMCGVKIADDGTPERWVAQNSFGLKRGPDGLAVMDREWWQTYMFRMVVRTDNLTPQQQTMRELTPETIPYWNLY